MKDDGFMNASDMVLRIMKNLDPEEFRRGNRISKLWKEIVESIKSNSINGDNIGKNMASHSRIIDFENGILLVEADHPGWIQMLGNYKKYILKGFQMKMPELKIETLAFRLAGSNAEISKISRKIFNYYVSLKKSPQKMKLLRKIDEEKQRNADELKIEREEKELERRGFVYKKDETEKRNVLPPEIQRLFDDMKNDIENSKN